MPYYFYVWTPEIVEHLAEHDVTPAEFEEVVDKPESPDVSRSSGNPVAFGYTSGGRYLCCVYQHIDQDLIEPITAYEIGE